MGKRGTKAVGLCQEMEIWPWEGVTKTLTFNISGPFRSPSHGFWLKELILEIRDPIHGTLNVSRQETLVLDSPAFQRLRMIKQLGFSEFSFPGATHSRYLHSLGVSYLAGQAFDFIFKDFQFSRGIKERESRVQSEVRK